MVLLDVLVDVELLVEVDELVLVVVLVLELLDVELDVEVDDDVDVLVVVVGGRAPAIDAWQVSTSACSGRGDGQRWTHGARDEGAHTKHCDEFAGHGRPPSGFPLAWPCRVSTASTEEVRVTHG